MIDDAHPLLLASGSPRRKDILETLGLAVRVRPVAADEAIFAGEAPEAYLARIVATKLGLALGLAEAADAPVVLVADTIVVVDADVLGKPRDVAEAAAMIARLSGRAHEVRTRFAAAAGATDVARTVTTKVVFRALTPVEIDRYAATGEGLDKAGAYAIQGVGSFAVARIEGSYSNVVGLPACEVVSALDELGVLGPFPRR